MRDYLKDYDEFWKDIIEDEYGIINLDLIKKELSDYKFILEQVSEVYCHITGGKLSKQHYYAGTVIVASDDYFGDIIKDLKEETFKCIDREIKELERDLSRYSTRGEIKGLKKAKDIINDII
jgi:hypothetical protein